jgi:hypothetical protein
MNPPEGRVAPAAGDSDDGQGRDGAPTARRLIAAYVAGCPARPPSAVLGQLGRQVAVLLTEGIDPEAIARALGRFSRKPMHPSVLPSLVNEELNAHSPPSRAAPPVAVAVAVPDADPDNPAAYWRACPASTARPGSPAPASRPATLMATCSSTARSSSRCPASNPAAWPSVLGRVMSEDLGKRISKLAQ